MSNSQNQYVTGSNLANYSKYYEKWDSAEGETCPECYGTGLDRDEVYDCDLCYGEGVIVYYESDAPAGDVEISKEVEPGRAHGSWTDGDRAATLA